MMCDMMKEMKGNDWYHSSRSGFTLIELLIYAVIFSISAVFLVNILTSVTQTEVRQNSVNNVNQQLSFVANTIQRLVRESSLVENAPGVASSTLSLRMSSSTRDRTLVYANASGTAIYVKQVNEAGTASTTTALTDDTVTVSNFSVTKFEIAGGSAVVQVDVTLNYNTTAPRAKVTRSWRGAITRVSAATFDSNLVPNASGAFDLGGSGAAWNNGFFSGNVNVAGKLGVGITPTDLTGTAAQMKVAGDIGFSSAANGVVLVSPGGACFRLGVSNSGTITTSTATCP